MEIKQNIHSCYVTNDKDFKSEILNTPCEFKFPPRSRKQKVFFLNNKQLIDIDLIYYNNEEVKHFKLWQGNLFNKDELLKLSKRFNLLLTKHPLVESILIAEIPKIEKGYSFVCYGVIKKVANQYFFMIYSKKGTTDFEDDTMYIFGIWEIMLSNYIKNKIFNT